MVLPLSDKVKAVWGLGCCFSVTAGLVHTINVCAEIHIRYYCGHALLSKGKEKIYRLDRKEEV